MEHCLFCRIVTKELPAKVVYETDEIVAFRDIHPLAPTHVLVVPKKHVGSVQDLAGEDAGLVGRMVLAAKEIAKAEGISETGYRIAMNVGPDAGQAVAHLHLHLLGGRRLGEMA